MKIVLEKEKDLRGNKVPWTSCAPFVENSRSVLIHRPRRVTTHKPDPRRDAHVSVHAWCGNALLGGKNLTFLDAPGKGRLVCARCEDNAVARGLPASSALVGHHVHVGGVVAVARCCTEEE